MIVLHGDEIRMDLFEILKAVKTIEMVFLRGMQPRNTLSGNRDKAGTKSMRNSVLESKDDLKAKKREQNRQQFQRWGIVINAIIDVFAIPSLEFSVR